ncbi:hypothetical protein FALBO_13570 [Fusarium albosuccineum]|uniref:Myb-like domain-containing protein n=1 Tax=Fusarium albosuccineum TaxID=1237068 RepID=A0A8H4KYJ5_9HYPO|nr:hypothetical protein FALBO_13570 [Fusarium albosuccineum]
MATLAESGLPARLFQPPPSEELSPSPLPLLTSSSRSSSSASFSNNTSSSTASSFESSSFCSSLQSSSISHPPSNCFPHTPLRLPDHFPKHTQDFLSFIPSNQVHPVKAMSSPMDFNHYPGGNGEKPFPGFANNAASTNFGNNLVGGQQVFAQNQHPQNNAFLVPNYFDNQLQGLLYSDTEHPAQAGLEQQNMGSGMPAPAFGLHYAAQDTRYAMTYPNPPEMPFDNAYAPVAQNNSMNGNFQAFNAAPVVNNQFPNAQGFAGSAMMEQPANAFVPINAPVPAPIKQDVQQPGAYGVEDRNLVARQIIDDAPEGFEKAELQTLINTPFPRMLTQLEGLLYINKAMTQHGLQGDEWLQVIRRTIATSQNGQVIPVAADSDEEEEDDEIDFDEDEEMLDGDDIADPVYVQPNQPLQQRFSFINGGMVQQVLNEQGNRRRPRRNNNNGQAAFPGVVPLGRKCFNANEFNLPPPDQENDSERDKYLLSGRAWGLTYKTIKQWGGFPDAESTLRGRFRALTKNTQDRVRKPRWEAADFHALDTALINLATAQNGRLGKIPWKNVADEMVRLGGTYHFGAGTVSKMYSQVKLF